MESKIFSFKTVVKTSVFYLQKKKKPRNFGARGTPQRGLRPQLISLTPSLAGPRPLIFLLGPAPREAFASADVAGPAPDGAIAPADDSGQPSAGLSPRIKARTPPPLIYILKIFFETHIPFVYPACNELKPTRPCNELNHPPPENIKGFFD